MFCTFIKCSQENTDKNKQMKMFRTCTISPEDVNSILDKCMYYVWGGLVRWLCCSLDLYELLERGIWKMWKLNWFVECFSIRHDRNLISNSHMKLRNWDFTPHNPSAISINVKHTNAINHSPISSLQAIFGGRKLRYCDSYRDKQCIFRFSVRFRCMYLRT